MDQILKVTDEKCVLTTMPNFLIFLNIPDSIERFGSTRSVWEGGEMGEGFIPKLKQRIYDLKPNFASNATESYHKDQSIITAVNESISDITNDPSTSFDNNVILKEMRDSFQHNKQQYVTEHVSTNKRRSSITFLSTSTKARMSWMKDSDDKTIGYVTMDYLINDDVNVFEMMVVISRNKIYFLVEKLSLPYEISVKIDSVNGTILFGAS